MKEWDSNVAAELVYIIKYAASQGYYDADTDKLIFQVSGKGNQYRDVVYNKYISIGVDKETEKFIKHIVKHNERDKRYKEYVVKKSHRTIKKLEYSPYSEK